MWLAKTLFRCLYVLAWKILRVVVIWLTDHSLVILWVTLTLRSAVINNWHYKKKFYKIDCTSFCGSNTSGVCFFLCFQGTSCRFLQPTWTPSSFLCATMPPGPLVKSRSRWVGLTGVWYFSCMRRIYCMLGMILNSVVWLKKSASVIGIGSLVYRSQGVSPTPFACRVYKKYKKNLHFAK